MLRLHEVIGRQLRQPTGLAGAAAALGMSLVNREPNRIAIEVLDVASDDTVLELGFGPGQAIAALTALARDGMVLGIDHSADMIRQASWLNRKAIQRGRAELRQARFDSLPWPAESIDKILAVNVVYFFGRDGAEVREARRIMRRGGTMVIYATAKAAMACLKFSSTHRFFDQNGIAELIMRGGFAANEVAVRPITPAFGISGLLAKAKKDTSLSFPMQPVDATVLEPPLRCVP